MKTYIDKISKIEPYDAGSGSPLCAVCCESKGVFSRVLAIDLISISKYQTVVMQQFLKYCWYSIIHKKK